MSLPDETGTATADATAPATPESAQAVQASVGVLPAHGVRYAFLDALRGVACLAVVAHHSDTVLGIAAHPKSTALAAAASQPVSALYRPLRFLCEQGAAGVQIFFVLSGFVIALSLKSFAPTGRGVARFIVRRQVRLDPTYWAALALASGIARVNPGSGTPPPQVGSLAAHAFYLQKLVGDQDALGTSWTLCVEIQFYLVFITLLALAALAGRRWGTVRRNHVATALVVTLGIASMFAPRSMVLSGKWFGPYWFYFAGGVLAYWAWAGRTSTWVFLAFVAAFAIAAPASLKSVLVGAPTCLLLYGVARTGRLASWSGGRVVQYFGRISYSLYLVHLVIMTGVLLGHGHPIATRPLPAMAWAGLVVAISIGVAHVLNVAIERPTARWSSRLPR